MDEQGPTKLPVIQYAKLRGMYPQKVYAVIRKQKLKEHWCDCGRKVVIIDEADKYFKLGRYGEDGVRVHGQERPGEPEPDRVGEGISPGVQGDLRADVGSTGEDQSGD